MRFVDALEANSHVIVPPSAAEGFAQIAIKNQG
jgi:hypothetical protein